VDNVNHHGGPVSHSSSPELDDDIGFLLSRASCVFMRASNAVLASYGLRVRSYSVLLLACSRCEEGISQRDVAGALGLDPSQVVLLVDDLASSGLVERRQSAADRRARLIVATGEGLAVRDEVLPLVQAAVAAQLGELTSTEQYLLKDLLARLVARTPSGSLPV
jgi:DNA-binding MarR family transcriptional regulator